MLAEAAGTVAMRMIEAGMPDVSHHLDRFAIG